MTIFWPLLIALTSLSAGAADQDAIHAGVQRVYDAVIGEDGQVNYKALKNNPDHQSALDDYVAFVGRLDFETISDHNEKIAILANTYNVFTLVGVTRAWPVTSVRKISPLFGFFKRQKWTFAGKEETLDSIENQYLRPLDNRIHFLINCASGSCPRLAPTVFTAENVTRLMDETTRDFLNDESKNRFDREKKRYSISKIFKWFGEDWGGEQGVIEFIQKHRPDLADWTPVKITYLDYDWALNGPTE